MSGQVSQINRLADNLLQSKKKLINTRFVLFTSKTNGQYKLKRLKNYTNEIEAHAFRQYALPYASD